MNHLERGEEGGRKGEEKGEIEKRRGKKEDLRKKEWGSMKGKIHFKMLLELSGLKDECFTCISNCDE